MEFMYPPDQDDLFSLVSNIPDNRVQDDSVPGLADLGGPRKCLVGNIRTKKESNPDWVGPYLFNRGQKIYLIEGKDERLFVLGRHRQGNGFITAWINAGHTENWRIVTIYKRVVLMNTSDYHFRGTTLEAMRDALNTRGTSH